MAFRGEWRLLPLTCGGRGSFRAPGVYGGAKPEARAALNFLTSLNPIGGHLRVGLNERMPQLNSTELARQLSLSKARISQYVAEGKLDGCYVGEGRLRRFDLEAVLEKLGRTLNKGQLLGNGAETRKAIATLKARNWSEDVEPSTPKARPQRQVDGGELDPNDPDRYELARTLKVEQEARRLLRTNAMEEGTLVLASEVAKTSGRLLAQEIAQFETVLRDGARSVADRLGVDFKTVRQILLTHWREHREVRSSDLHDQAEAATLTAEEQDADF